MVQSQKKRQQALERQKAKRKQKQQTSRSVVSAGTGSLLPTVGNWEVRECLVTRNWQEEGLVQILIARQSPAGKVVAGAFLVDLGCLGVKNVNTKIFSNWEDYSKNLREIIMSSQAMVGADLNLAAKILREAIAYARQFDFNPHRDFSPAQVLLTGADPDASDVFVPLGKDGKPFFVAGPYDNAKQIMAKLTKTAGPGNFNYLSMIDPSDDLGDFEIINVDDDDEEDDEEEDDKD